ncbi:peptidoglycan editing factor PgeF [Desulfosporosinus sp. PR]|uniref:peptidoglycan editing factor PgeF n=1 Tax=Candidatus Desulfosporosinus nitrosoreducens TaxID=3401928 RepID=UPI0027FEC13E|nr:peptidoglycan editing factor PgeF [Desulfosporosinus sp. PR]MDQ7096150.1 peptidoglycan editing factor PgeF [Desulfosporosinus sp. PR]
MNWNWRTKGDLSYLTISQWLEEGIDVGFSTRNGGFSGAPYASLNLGLHVGDEPAAVVRNRKRWLETWDVPWPEAVVGEQVHGANVVWVHESDKGRGVRELDSVIPAVDGFVTQSSVGLMAFYADCVPLFFYEPNLKAVGIAHAGWKGTVQKIGLKVLERLEEIGGCAENVWVAIGPGIGPCCYTVDEPVACQFRFNFGETSFLHPLPDGHYHLDLWEANKNMLLERGVRKENLAVAAICTKDNPEWFFSHRRDGVRTGRMAGWIRMRGKRHDDTMYEHKP